MADLSEYMYPLADTLQIDLKYEGKSGEITSVNREFVIPLMQGAHIVVKPSVVSSFFNKKERQMGVLCHMSGKLYMLAAINMKTRTLSCYMVSSEALGMRRLDLVGFLPKKCNIKTAVGKVKGGVKKAYSRSLSRQKWSELEIPKG